MTFILDKSVGSTKVFLTPSSRLEGRWDPNFYRCMSQFRERMRDCPHPLEKLKRSLALVQYGISERASSEPIGVPMLRMINLQGDAWDLSDLKYISLADLEQKPYLLRRGDILFNRTNSKELVGKCCVFDLPDDYVFASYLVRVRLKENTLHPDYVTAFLASSLGRIQIDAVSRQIAGMTNINAEEIRNLLVPIPDKLTQNQVVRAWHAAIQKRDRTIDKAKSILATIDDTLLGELGIDALGAEPQTLEHRIFETKYSNLTGHRGDPLFHQTDIFGFIRESCFELSMLGRHINYFLSGFAAGRDEQVYEEDGGVIQIRPTNISEDRELVFRRNVFIDASELRLRRLDVLKRGEVLFNNTNSQDLVGKSVCFDLDGDYFSSNHITRIATKPEELNAAYLAYVLNLYQRRKVFFKLCTNWNNQSGVGSEVLRRIPVPVPTSKRQVGIVSRLDKIREEARTLRASARTDFEGAKSDIELLILGKGGNA